MKRKPSEILEQAHAAGISYVSSNDAGEYTCHQCGHTWKRRARWLVWPISFAWSPPPPECPLFSRWSWQAGWDAIEQKVFGWSIRIGRLVIKFGERRRVP